MPITLIKSSYRTKPKLKTQKPEKQNETTLLPPNLQSVKQKLLSVNGFVVDKQL